MHDVGEGEGVNAHGQHGRGQQGKHQELAGADVLELGHVGMVATRSSSRLPVTQRLSVILPS